MKKFFILAVVLLFANSSIFASPKDDVILLPLGSVVQLKKAKEGAKLMIISRTPLAAEKGVEGYYDYAGVPHVRGLINNQQFSFNHEDIEMIYFTGYVDEKEEEYREFYKKAIKTIKYPKFKN